MTIHPRAALIYTVTGLEGFDALLPLLREHHLYAADRRCEAQEHVNLPSAARPVLLFLLHLAEHANDPLDPCLDGREQTRAERDRVEFFVCVDVSELGPTRAEQVAVVGVLQGYGLSVIAGSELLDAGWYQMQLRKLGGWAAIDGAIAALERPFPEGAIEGHLAAYNGWAAATLSSPAPLSPSRLFFAPTSWRLTYAETIARARQLRARGLVADHIADCLMAEGYADRYGARTWYWSKVERLLSESDVKRGAAGRDAS